MNCGAAPVLPFVQENCGGKSDLVGVVQHLHCRRSQSPHRRPTPGAGFRSRGSGRATLNIYPQRPDPSTARLSKEGSNLPELTRCDGTASTIRLTDHHKPSQGSWQTSTIHRASFFPSQRGLTPPTC